MRLDDEPGPSTTPPSQNGFKNGSKHTKKHFTQAPQHVVLPGTTLYDDSSIDREQFIRVVVQTLRDIGYIESAATLEAESGYLLESAQVAEFRQCILDASWSEAESALARLGVADHECLQRAHFLISQQKYLELLEAQNINAALQVLRNELAPLNDDVNKLHSLSGLIMCSNAEDLMSRAKWDGALGNSRKQLLADLQQFIPSSVMIPQRRMASLIDQAFTHQRTQCLYHNTPISTFSLYTDHRCTRDSFPSLTTIILQEHKDEVWNIQWSHDGRYLATASKDKTAIIWRIGPEPEPGAQRDCASDKILKDHQDPVGSLAWSLDDSLLLTCSESMIKMWNVKSGLCIRELQEHNDIVSSVVWLPDGSGFISGGMDRKIIVWDSDGNLRESWGTTVIRITDLAVTPDFTRVVALGIYQPQTGGIIDNGVPPTGTATPQVNGTRVEYRIIVYNFASRDQEASMTFEGELTSVKISHDSRYALVNHAPDEIQLWDLHNLQMTRKFTGQRQGKHVIRSCFGGVDGNFIVSGSEDGNVYVWHRDTGCLLQVLEGHGSGSVNSVAWNPSSGRMFASCSDDWTVRIWEPPPLELLATDSPIPRSSAEQNGKGKGKSRESWDAVGMLD